METYKEFTFEAAHCTHRSKDFTAILSGYGLFSPGPLIQYMDFRTIYILSNRRSTTPESLWTTNI